MAVTGARTMTSDGQLRRHAADADHSATSAQNDVIVDGDITSSRRPAVLPHRHWICRVPETSPVVVEQSAAQSSAAARLRVATYNVLSDGAIQPGEYLYCPPQLRYMSGRHDRIIAEIGCMRPHVICLQVRADSGSSFVTTHDDQSHLCPATTQRPTDPRARPNKRIQKIGEHVNTKLQTQINITMTEVGYCKYVIILKETVSDSCFLSRVSGSITVTKMTHSNW